MATHIPAEPSKSPQEAHTLLLVLLLPMSPLSYVIICSFKKFLRQETPICIKTLDSNMRVKQQLDKHTLSLPEKLFILNIY